MEPRTWFVTGAASGLGLEIVRAALQDGAHVVAAARRPDSLAGLVGEWGQERIIPVKLDVTSQTETADAVAKAIASFDRIDVLCINAGMGMLGTIEEVSPEQVRQTYETNVFGPLHLLRATLPLMRQRKSGHIILVSSVGGIAANPGSGIYSSSKFALEGIGEALAEEVRPFGIHVTLIEPGGLRTGFAGPSIQSGKVIDDYAETAAGKWRTVMRSNHGKQPGDPAEAARLIVDISRRKDPPLRMVMGRSAIERARRKLASLAEQIEGSWPIGASIDKP